MSSSIFFILQCKGCIIKTLTEGQNIAVSYQLYSYVNLFVASGTKSKIWDYGINIHIRHI